MKLIRWCIAYINGESTKEFSPAQILQFSAVALALSHFCILSMFLYARVYFMVAVNIGSLLTYVATFFVARKGNYRLFYLMVYIEVCIHIVLATLTIGEDAGFMMHWIAILSVLYMCCYGFRTMSDASGRFRPFVFNMISFLLFLALKLYCLFFEPVHPLADANIYHMFYTLNYGITLFSVVLSLSIFITQALTLHNRLLQQNRLLEKLSTTDTLTGLSNRRIVTNFFEFSAQESIPFCAILGDIDDFKKINDTYGHDCGDRVLVTVADIFRSCTRENDIVCRWGGEEILVILPDCSLPNARKIAVRIKNTLSASSVSYEGQSIHVTMTLGVASSDEASDMHRIVQIADNNLYYGKRHGKNCVITSELAG